ncbi:MAG: hypothetical protein NTZ05_18350 [Chloroflexi bacterium]|nr:hypothetical protein [Chloroflexota bacterium]
MSPSPARTDPPSMPAETLDGLLRVIEAQYGLRFTGRQQQEVAAAAAQLAATALYGDALQLYRALAAGTRPEVLETLVVRLTVGETHFFRVAPQMDALRQVVLPEVMARRMAERQVRCWSAGCATGEEPYTLAILLGEQFPAQEWSVSVIATDLNRMALEIADRGVYGEWSFRDTPLTARERYFTQDGPRWRLNDPVRRMVRFQQLNLAADPSPGAGFDLILCRNVTIYFTPDATQRLYRQFAAALAPAGWLVLGPSDPPPEQPGPLEPVMLPNAVLWRRAASVRAESTPRLVVPSVLTMPRPRPNAAPPTLPAARSRPARPPSPAPQPMSAPTLEQVRALAHGGDRTAARALAQRFAAAQPLAAEAHLLLGMLALEAGAANEALDSLRRAAFLDASAPLAHFSLGRAYLDLGEPVRAGGALVQARRLLAALPDDAALPDTNGLTAGELRQAAEALLGAAGRAAQR